MQICSFCDILISASNSIKVSVAGPCWSGWRPRPGGQTRREGGQGGGGGGQPLPGAGQGRAQRQGLPSARARGQGEGGQCPSCVHCLMSQCYVRCWSSRGRRGTRDPGGSLGLRDQRGFLGWAASRSASCDDNC